MDGQKNLFRSKKVEEFSIMLLKLVPLSLQRVISRGTWTTQFAGASTTTTKAGWLSCNPVTTTSTPGWPSPRATQSAPRPAGSSWGRTRQRGRRLWCRPTAAWTATVGLRRSLACAQPRRERWSRWRRETSSVSGYQTFRRWTTRKEQRPLGCTNCRTPLWAYAWTCNWRAGDSLSGWKLLRTLLNRLDQ